MKRSLVWSGVAMLAFALLQIYGVRSQGHDWPVVFKEAHYWLLLWPGFFLTIFFFTGGWIREVPDRAYVAGRKWAAGEREGPLVSCPRCGATNSSISPSCHGCGARLREAVGVSPGDGLAGAQHSAPSILYLVAIVASVGGGVLTLMAIGEERFLENTGVMIGGFMGGMSVSLTLFFFLISRWAGKKYGG